MKLKRIGVCALTALIGAGACVSFTACGGKSKIVATTSDAAHTFNYWVTKTDGTGIGGDYKTYEQNPSIVRLTDRDFTYKSATKDGNSYVQGGEVTNKIALHFEYPSVIGQEQNSFITSLASGTTDILELDYAPETVTKMYRSGKVLDLTWWVENYMPNYKKYVEDHGLYKYFTTEIDGQRKYLQLYNMLEAAEDYWGGYQYRRDWVLKYGVDPANGATTGNTFAQDHSDWGWQQIEGKKTWVDDIKFPSYYGYTYTTADNGKATGMGTLTKDATLENYIKNEYPKLIGDLRSEYGWENYQGQWPVTISDWEWMLDIFQIAIEKLGYGERGYCMTLYQPGFVNTGNLVSSFGGGGVEWYKTPEGKVVFGGDTPTFKTYVDTMRQWYSNGWIDTNFQSHSGLFWRWDENTIRQGYVGLFYGMDNQLLDYMDQSNGVEQNPTYGLCSYAMPFPINDKYGDDSMKYKEPYCFYGLEKESNTIMISTDAEKNGKDLAGLFTFLDSLYTKENSRMKGAGLNKEQLEASQDGVKEMYEKHGLVNGAWYEQDGKCYMTPEFMALSGDIQQTFQSLRLFGLEGQKFPPTGSKEYQFTTQLWGFWSNSGYLARSFYNQLTPDEYDIYNQYTTSMRNTFISEVPKFIKGESNMSGWDSWYSGMKSSCRIDMVTGMLDALNTKLEG